MRMNMFSYSSTLQNRTVACTSVNLNITIIHCLWLVIDNEVILVVYDIL